jgi:hypothetical protein
MEKIVLKEWGEDWNNIARTAHGNIIFVKKILLIPYNQASFVP